MRILKAGAQQGAITVFFSIILLILITLTGIIVDGARIRTGETMAREAANTALHSVLANYNETLKEDYGLFAMELKEEDIDRLLSFYIEGTLRPHERADLLFDNQIPWDLYDFSIESLKATPMYSLTNDDVIGQQILEFMKYRAPKAIVEEGLNYFFELEKVGRAAKDLEQKLEIERELESLSQKQLELEKIIDRLNSFRPDSHVALLEDMAQEVNDRIYYQERKLEIEAQQQRIRDYLSATQDPEERRSYSEDLADLRNQRDEANRGERRAVENIGRIHREITNAIVSAMSDCNQLTVTSQQLKQLMAQIKEKTLAMERNLSQRSSSDKDEYEKHLMEELEGYREFLEGEELIELIETAENTKLILEESKLKLDSAHQIALEITVDSNQSLGQLNRAINEFRHTIGAVNLGLNYQKPDVPEIPSTDAGDYKDNRREVASKANALFKETRGNDIVIDSSTLARLPSRGAGSEIDSNEVEFNEKSGSKGYSEGSLSEIGQQTSIIMSSLEQIRDHLYINEYSVGIFKTALSGHEDLKYNLRNQSKEQRISFFDYEVEYILYGNPSQEKNLTKAKRDLVATRFVLNLIYVYRNPELLKAATALAAVIAAPLGGAAMPLIKTMILCGWAMGYSLEDVQTLMKGERVNFYRGQDRFKMGYEDYLRLFLLRPGLSQSLKLNRIKDLIQLNLEKNPLYDNTVDINRYYTYLQLELDYSLKVLFLRSFSAQGDGPVMGKDRHQMKLLQWQGY